MITRIEIDGFKSFRNFQMEFSPLTVIAGANASGKSNLFDALHLLSRLADMDLKAAFSGLRGEPIEQFTYYGNGQYADEMSFVVDLLVDQQVRDNWDSEATLTYTRLRYGLKIRRLPDQQDLTVSYESLYPIPYDDAWIERYLPVETRESWVPTRGLDYRLQLNTIYDFSRVYGVYAQDGSYEPFKNGAFQGTTAKVIRQTYLSSFNRVDTPHLLAAREEIRNWRIYNVDPDVLRAPSGYLTDSTILPTGENMAAVLYRIKQTDSFSFASIRRKLANLLPGLTDLDVIDDKADQRYIIRVKSSDGREFTSRVLSEGTLRLLVLCVLQYDDQHKGVTCLEEPENGTHPFRLKLVAQLLSDLSDNFMDTDFPLRQVIVNTHSPLLVNEVLQVELRQFVSVWFTQLVTQNALLNDRRVSLQITRILPVETEKESRYPSLSETEKKISLRQLQQYLQSTDVEDTLNDLSHL
ncbi:AAA family ATPase [Spirosoma sp. KUDC1026]|uniref:AAA family ATPase n=1 Tax=Spirosoma sp. KUDC1026 TaxID=2745947 RepID=UPI00159BC80B|nr:AAA family ATPase [Spirosoma sp. KUDC1026]QKZ12963.1 AAA family ATPase [Spirosoma sp. KUDC1026]